jgi:hypothetical protein
MRTFFLLTLLLFLVGCSHYEYNLLEPQDLAQHVGTDADARFTVDPLNYYLRSYEDRLVMRIENPTDGSIELLGDQSSVVSPDCQSHPLRAQSIAPKSYIKLIFPPLRPRYWGPSLGIGMSGTFGRADWPHGPYPYRYPEDYGPYYFYVADDNAYYWDWEGAGPMRVNFIFQRGPDRLTQSFVFARVKM